MSELLRELARRTGLPERNLRRIIATAPERYKHYTIPKRDGGHRAISQPSHELKAVQRAMSEAFLSELPIHPAATAYRLGASLRDNVLPHVHSGPILKMDLKNFFPSIRVQDWTSYCEERSIFEEEDVNLSGQLLFYRQPGTRALRLAIGAPSSPILSNILMFDFDAAVDEAVSRDKVIYTRYADDMTFSAPRTGHLTVVKRSVAQTIRRVRYPKLEINDEKTVYATKKYRRVVTGLTISNDERVTLGRDRKRLISSQVHHATLGKLSRSELESLSGMLAFANAVEPEFLGSLRRKYGVAEVNRIIAVKPTRGADHKTASGR